jgi:hypothetical protein
MLAMPSLRPSIRCMGHEIDDTTWLHLDDDDGHDTNDNQG